MKNNSLITIPLFFMGSLVIMLAATPAVNIFSNAMAQGYDADYYRYNSYSKYPTDDKKYECRTGPFEGFFVSSVEFCKHIKFDDKRDRDVKIGPQGPQGPPGANGTTGPQGIQGIQGERGFTGLTGPTGPASTVPGPQGERGSNGTNGINGTNGTNGAQGAQGPQGPSGINQLNGTNTYLVTKEGVTNDVFSNNVGQAICNTSDFVINGGFVMTGVTNGGADLLEALNRPILNPLASGWEVHIGPTALDGGVRYTVYAICFDNPPLR